MRVLSLALLICVGLTAACNSTSPTSTPAPSQPAASATVTPTNLPPTVVPTVVVPTAPPTASVQPTPASAASPTLIPQLQLTAESKDTLVVLTWTGVPEARGYSIYRDGNTAPLNTKPITQTTFQDIGLTNGRTHTYTVAAVSADATVTSSSAPITAIPQSQ